MNGLIAQNVLILIGLGVMTLLAVEQKRKLREMEPLLKAREDEIERLKMDREFYSCTKAGWKARAEAAERELAALKEKRD